jgi:hypothetical protein
LNYLLGSWGCTWLIVTSVLASVGCQPNSPPAPTAEPPAEVAPQKAVAGVGRQGQKLKDDTGVARIISGPAASLFNFQQKAVLDIQIPQALQLFQATEGRMPKSHEEFMQKIVQANRLVLPDLPAGAVYRFDPDKGELWVYPEHEAP